MSELVDHLAELTGFRDRELLDVTLVGALKDLLRPRAVAIYRSVGEPGNERWMTRARLTSTDPVATADPAWVDIETLPPHSADAARLDAFRRGVIVHEACGDHQRALFPVATDRETHGVMEIETDAPMDDRDQRLVMSILRIYRNFQGLLDYSERDTLTGLLNRKTFDDSFLKALSDPNNALPGGPDGRRQGREPCGYWLGVIDIDHFKRVNDNHGHLIGDEVLLLLSRLMRSTFRFHDQLYRFGGEEFVVLMRCAGSDAAMHAFERLRSNVEQYGFPQVGRITVSIGLTELRPGDTPTSTFERADRAVYFAKGNGRNQVRNHADLIASGDLTEDDKISDVELF
jgi:diguanylate cyclase (GGDEF)-like protein